VEYFVDGYNLMHAWMGLESTRGPEAFRRARRRFLDRLAEALGPGRRPCTTVVFDANKPPGDFALYAQYQGMELVFALGDENADARLELMIAQHSHPKSLVVVSSDRRVRTAAARRKARSIRSEDFLDLLERPTTPRPQPVECPDPVASPGTAQEDWARNFAAVDGMLKAHPDLAPPALLTDSEIAELEREIEAEW
jgi:predicted RNA-binding protein with PIN domain